MGNPLEDQELQELLAVERADAGPDDGARARVWGRLAGTLAVPGAGGQAGPGGATPMAAAKVGGGLAVKVGLVVGLAAGGGAWVALRPGPASERPSVAPSVAPAIAPGTASAPSVPPSDASLAAERRLLIEAMQALRGGRLEAAEAALGRHAARFPAGRLGEERAALGVQVLAARGRVDEARAAADAFLARYPGSVLRATVEAAVQKP
ncbi:MAG: hypothetical protein R3F60_18025 [bacterium]